MILYYAFGIFVAGPFIEWGIHYAIHRPPPLIYHKNHHLAYYRKDPIYELWVVPVIYFLYLLGCYIAAIGFAKYTIVHNIIHYFPGLFPKLTRHHQIHHENPKVNFAVSSTFPDTFFNTRSKYFPSELKKI